MSKTRLTSRIFDQCVVCHGKAVGINFSVATCAPCKAFFRRNARRKEVLNWPCQFRRDETKSNSNVELPMKRTSYFCPQIRHCTSCRLHRCFESGMKEELVRTDEERQRYRQLIENNRQRRRQIQNDKNHRNAPNVSHTVVHPSRVELHEKDWILLSNIVNAYEKFCLKTYIDKRSKILSIELQSSENLSQRKKYCIHNYVNTISSFLSFLSSIPIVKSLNSSDRIYLCQHNVRSLVFPNLHELEQNCFSEPWQLEIDDLSTEYICGKNLYQEYVGIKNRANSILINDPVVTRLWLIILFFSSPLQYSADGVSSDVANERKLIFNRIQESYVILLWNYLVHRHGDVDSVRIFSNLTRIFLQMQCLFDKVDAQVQMCTDVFPLDQILNRVSVFDEDRIEC